MSGSADLVRDGARGRPAAAPDIDDALAGLNARMLDQNIRDWCEQRILRFLAFDPVLSGGSIPEGDLVGVLEVTYGSIHGRLLRFAAVWKARNLHPWCICAAMSNRNVDAACKKMVGARGFEPLTLVSEARAK